MLSYRGIYFSQNLKLFPSQCKTLHQHCFQNPFIQHFANFSCIIPVKMIINKFLVTYERVILLKVLLNLTPSQGTKVQQILKLILGLIELNHTLCNMLRMFRNMHTKLRNTVSDTQNVLFCSRS